MKISSAAAVNMFRHSKCTKTAILVHQYEIQVPLHQVKECRGVEEQEEEVEGGILLYSLTDKQHRKTGTLLET